MALNSLSVSLVLKWAIAWPFALSAYAFCVATPLAAVTRNRGLASGAKAWARAVYWANRVGAFASLLGAAALLVAAWTAL